LTDSRVTVRVTVRLTQEDAASLDDLVARGRFASRSEGFREVLAQLLREEREREIDEAYRRGYGKYPQEEWIGELGLAALAAWDKSEREAERKSAT
jgi:Arc/MetJ-type ribon-helix-helix transcriptional regulator